MRFFLLFLAFVCGTTALLAYPALGRGHRPAAASSSMRLYVALDSFPDLEVFKAVAPLATIIVFSNVIVNNSDKRSAENIAASDKLTAASNKRFDDLMKSFREIRGADKETLNAIVDKLSADIGFLAAKDDVKHQLMCGLAQP